jgi:hypothetical protein
VRDDDEVSRGLYELLRAFGGPVTKAQARFIWMRTQGASFVAGPDGVSLARLERLVQLRVLALRSLPISTVARYDR